jgi:site-specific recombinase XerD
MNPFADVQVSIPEANLKNRKPSEKDIQILLLAPNPKTPIGIRDIALLRLLTIYGLEVWQIEQLDTKDVDEENEVE